MTTGTVFLTSWSNNINISWAPDIRKKCSKHRLCVYESRHTAVLSRACRKPCRFSWQTVRQEFYHTNFSWMVWGDVSIGSGVWTSGLSGQCCLRASEMYPERKRASGGRLWEWDAATVCAVCGSRCELTASALAVTCCQALCHDKLLSSGTVSPAWALSQQQKGKECRNWEMEARFAQSHSIKTEL